MQIVHVAPGDTYQRSTMLFYKKAFLAATDHALAKIDLSMAQAMYRFDPITRAKDVRLAVAFGPMYEGLAIGWARRTGLFAYDVRVSVEVYRDEWVSSRGSYNLLTRKFTPED